MKLIIDASSQIPVEFAKAYNIAFIEQLIELEGEYRKEVSEVNLEDFVSIMKKLDPLPKTTLGSPQHIVELYEQVIQDGYKEALYLYVTPELSNQISTANIASKKVKDKLNVQFFATGHAGPSQAPFGLYAAELLEEGKTSEEILSILEKLKPMIYTIGVSSSFDTLFRSGKIKKSVKMTLISSLMNLKPLYESTVDKGFAGFGAGAGYGGAMKKLIASIEEKTDPKQKYNIIISHTKNEKLAQKLEAMTKAIRQVQNVDVWSISPVVTNTLGYGTAMITLYPTLESLK